MSKIYKYASIESGIKILESNSVVVNNPQNYNDPFDCIMDFDDRDMEKVVLLIAEYYLTKEFLSLLQNRNIKIPIILKSIMWLEKNYIEIFLKASKNRGYYESIPFLKLLSKYMVNYLHKNNKSDFKEKQRKFVSDVVDNMNELRKNAYISCFSKNNDSILMWSHYGNNHTGICIEYERPEKDYFDVVYSKKRKPLNLEDTARRLLAYMLTETNVEVDNPTLIKNIMKPFLTKSKEWQYEEEVRCIFTKENENIFQKDNRTLLKMETPITAIYIGCKACEKDIKAITEIANSNGIKVKKMKQNDHYYKVEVE